MIRTKYCLGIWGAFFLERASNNRADRNYLKPRLTLLMQLQGVWGEISNLYGSGESIFTDQHKSLPPGIRSPESRFTRYWDLLQLIPVVYGRHNYRTAARTLFDRPYLAHFCSVFRRFFAVCSVLAR